MVLLILFFLSSPVNAGPFIEGSIGLHNESQTCPEFCYGDSLTTTIGAGYAIQLKSAYTISTGVEHLSAPTVQERSRGMNRLYIKGRYEWINF